MNNKELEKHIIQNYKNKEKMMILIYAQWCINNDLDPIDLYKEAYPNQIDNEALTEAMDLTVSKNESEHIDHQTVLHALQLFGNDDLAFIVQEKVEQRMGL